MFVSNLTKPLIKPLGLIGSLLCMSLVGATTAIAAEAPDADWKIRPGNIPVTVTITNLDPAPKGSDPAPKGSDPVYVSIQTKDQYQSMKGGGGVTPYAKTGAMTATFFVDEPGDYAVSVWHDRDGDARFSMSADYTVVLDSYGASGQPPKDNMPTFDDVKFSVPNMGTSLSVDMINPQAPL